jgi:hypothetical protein
MEALIRLARETGDKKYLEPVPRALAYFKTCLLPDGQVARYYELKTNKPLYMDASYKLTYDASAAPEHYGWKQNARFDAIEKQYEAAMRGESLPAPKRDLTAEVRKIVASLDANGRWVSKFAGERLVGQPKFPDGFAYISSAVLSQNLETLSEFLAATRK